MKILLANGCSHTAGSDIDPNNLRSCPDQAWPRWVADHYNIPYVNIAEGGSGNEQISRSTILAVSNLIDIDKFNPADLIVAICWSGFDRYEYWSTRADDFRSFSMSSTNSVYKPEGIVSKYIELRSLVETEDYANYKNLYHIYNTARFLELHGIKYYFSNALNSFIPPHEFKSSDNLTKNYSNMVRLYGERIKNHLGFFDNSLTLRTYLQPVVRSPLGQGNHWDSIGQKKYADLFIKHIESVNENPIG